MTGAIPSGADRHEARVAIEALRAGVPNRAAIRRLGSAETAIGAQFTQALDAIWDPQPHAGMLFAGGFGAGKSHLLGTLREQALRRNFVVSWVTVSKETPLSQPGPMFAAAMRGAVVPGRPDDAVTVALAELQHRREAVEALEHWAGAPESGLGQVFAAVTHLLNWILPPDLLHGIEAFLCGGKPPTAAVRRQLAALGARGIFDLGGVNAAALHVQRPRFMARLLRAAGFAGWCVLIDEVELIGRYGPVQRAAAYGELGRWLGLAPELRVPGLHATCAITDDFADQVIAARQDEQLPERLRQKGLPRQADLAEAAIAAIRRAHLLHAPTDDDLARDGETVRACYAAAYDWPAPQPVLAERHAARTMRHHVRGWITEWDMLRLLGSSGGLEMSAMASDYSEDPDLADPPADPD